MTKPMCTPGTHILIEENDFKNRGVNSFGDIVYKAAYYSRRTPGQHSLNNSVSRHIGRWSYRRLQRLLDRLCAQGKAKIRISNALRVGYIVTVLGDEGDVDD